MKNKLMFLTKMSLKKKMGTKWFYVVNILLCVLVVGLINIDSIITFFGGNFSDKTEILVIDNAEVYDDFVSNYEVMGTYIEDLSSVEFKKYDKDIEEAKKEVDKDDKLLIVIDKDNDNFIKASITSKEGVDALVSQIISTSLNVVKKNIALSYYGIDTEMLAHVDSPVVLEKVRLDDGKSVNEMMEMVTTSVFPILVLPFFMLSLFLVQMIGAEVNEEKSTKSMEIIISNVSPRTHFMSKILSGNLFVIFQGLLLVVDVVVGILVSIFFGGGFELGGEVTTYVGDLLNELNSMGVIDKLAYVIPFALVLMLITFVAYSLLAGILASMTTNVEDYQQLQSPIMIISLVGYYLSLMAGMFDGSIFIKIMSFVPFISAVLSPALLMLGQISILDMIIAIGIMIVTIWLLFKYGMKIYKVGILNYSSTGLWKKMFKAVRN